MDRLPPEATKQRADLQRTIEARINDLVDATHRGQALRKAALSYRGNWRDIVLFLCALLFTIIWWADVHHNRSNWLPMFVLLILLSVVTAVTRYEGWCAPPFRWRRGGTATTRLTPRIEEQQWL